MIDNYNIGKMHTDEQIIVKLSALIKECKDIYSINKARRESEKEYTVEGIDFKIESMNQLATELEREIKSEGE